MKLMLSDGQNEVQVLIESKLSGNHKSEALLFHVSVQRKLASVDLWFRHMEIILPVFTGRSETYSSTEDSKVETEDRAALESILIKMSAYIDAFFMSGRSTLDAFGHEIRSLYGLGDHTGNLYFPQALGLISTHHGNSHLNTYLNSLNIEHSQWYTDLNSYRRACAHESIIQINPSRDFDFLKGEWKEILLKLPMDPGQRPWNYDGKNFVDTGKTIKNELYGLIETSYDRILDDIKSGQTKIDYDNGSAKPESNS